MIRVCPFLPKKKMASSETTGVAQQSSDQRLRMDAMGHLQRIMQQDVGILPLFEGERAETTAGEGRADSPPIEELLAEESRLSARRKSARQRMSRPFRLKASAGGHEERKEQRAEAQLEAAPPGASGLTEEPDRGQRIAMAAGSAVHAFLEHYDPMLEAAAAWGRVVMSPWSSRARRGRAASPGAPAAPAA